ncbi:MAG: DUF4097 domain-containing protein [Candidatus Krumholzibacteria bacterium]|nr:DUF4097 domain-containing protein [Candidatus Krumholzibacteria bacterium]
MSRLKWQIVVGVVLVAVLSVVSAVAQRSSQSKSFPVKKGGLLVVDTDNVSADIHIKVWAKSEVLVKVDGISEDDMVDLEMKESGNTVYVEYFGKDRRWHRSQHARFVISVPSEFNLELATSGGDISVDDKLKGDVEAATAGGDIEVDDVDGNVELATSGGDVSVRNVTGDAELATSGGDIDVGEVKGKLDVKTSGGDIEVGNVGQGIDAKTAGGDIIIGDVGGDADVATAGGDVELGRVAGAADLRTAGGDIEVRSARGEVSARTAGGDVRLADIKGTVEAETAGGDVVVELTPEGRRGSVLETKGGDIELFIPAGAKATIEADIRLHRGWADDHDEYDIYSDFKADSKDKDKRGIHATYVLNGGGPKIVLETMHGNIEIRKLK